MNKKKYIIIIIGIVIYAFIAVGQGRVPIEEVEDISGIGYDIERKGEDMIEYIISLSEDIYSASGVHTDRVLAAKGENVGEVIQNRQEMMNKKFVQGHEQVILISEDYARYGLKQLIEERLRSAEANDRAYLVICNGKAEDYLKYKIKGYHDTSSYLSGLVEASVFHSFFSNNYKLIDAFVRIGAEGRSLVLPYIKIKEDRMEVAGLAIFKEDKMITVADEKNSKILNFLRESDVMGLVSLQKSAKEYIDFEGRTGKRKVKSYKQGDKYCFDIDLTLTGNIASNEINPEILTDINQKEQFEKDMAKSLENQCYEFIKIMKNEYKVDCIGLGKEAVAKFGRQKNIDWNEVVLNADIKVNVKVKVSLQGRGDY